MLELELGDFACQVETAVAAVEVELIPGTAGVEMPEQCS